MEKENKLWTKEEEAKLVELVAYMDYESIAKELGRTYASVTNKANELGLKLSELRWTDAEINHIVALYKAGVSMRDIGRAKKSSHHTIKKLLMNEGIIKD